MIIKNHLSIIATCSCQLSYRVSLFSSRVTILYVLVSSWLFGLLYLPGIFEIDGDFDDYKAEVLKQVEEMSQWSV